MEWFDDVGGGCGGVGVGCGDEGVGEPLPHCWHWTGAVEMTLLGLVPRQTGRYGSTGGPHSCAA